MHKRDSESEEMGSVNSEGAESESPQTAQLLRSSITSFTPGRNSHIENAEVK
jgi:hypothetical protein